MVAIMKNHEVRWAAPSPLWPVATIDASETNPAIPYNRPAILRFADDSFMDEFMKILERDPLEMRNLIVAHETWENPITKAPLKDLPEIVSKEPISNPALRLNRLRLAMKRLTGIPEEVTDDKKQKTDKQIKLYQPGHQRYYLITASLLCGGAADHKIDTGCEERVSFVIRRLKRLNDSEHEEYAFIESDGKKVWTYVSKTGEDIKTYQTKQGEERLPLFAVNYTDDDGHKKRVLAGLIPVGKKDLYTTSEMITKDNENPPISNGGVFSGEKKPKNDRMLLFIKKVGEPWKNVLRDAYRIAESFREFIKNSDFGNEEQNKMIDSTREHIQTISWYVLLDLGYYLKDYLPEVWEIVKDNAKEQALLEGDPQKSIINLLKNIKSMDNKTSLCLVLNKLKDVIDTPEDKRNEEVNWRNNPFHLARIFKSSDTQDNPGKYFECLKVSDYVSPLSKQDGVEDQIIVNEPVAKLDDALKVVDKLTALIVRALPVESEKTPLPPLATQIAIESEEPSFVIRCVYERPHCGHLHPPFVSKETVQFQMAGFFDPDAPARPIRIALPVDTSPAGLRKFDKNTAFMLSDMLCGQVKRAKSLGLGDLVRSVLPWPLHKDLNLSGMEACQSGGTNIGMICSLSIPIVTICAFILLIIIVTLLDYIFRWLPYFIFCFPIPGFKAKK